MRFKFAHEGHWLTWDDRSRDATLELPTGIKQLHLDADQIKACRYHQEQAFQNPLAYFLPHGVPWHDKPKIYSLPDGGSTVTLPPSLYPKKYGNDGVAFQNDRTNGFVTLVAPRKVGKEQPIDSMIQTPQGEKRMGCIVLGDTVFGSDGRPCVVVNITDNGIRDVYRVAVDSGHISTECGLDHLWAYLPRSRAHKRHGRDKKHKGSNFDKWMVASLAEIIAMQGMGDANDKAGYIPRSRPVQYPSARTLIDPYVMGVILGDGGITTRAIVITTADDFIPEEISRRIPDDCRISKCGGRYHWKILSKDNPRADGTGRFQSTNSMINALRELGLMGKRSSQKHIPIEYIVNDESTRRSVLAGLLDTDGTIGTNYSAIEFSSTSHALALGVMRIVRSLGGVARIKSRTTSCTYKGKKVNGALSYRVTIKMDECPFLLPRKTSRWANHVKRREHRIHSISHVGKKQCRCIEVTSPDRTYLTDDFIVTHNSFAGAAKIAFDAIPTDPSWPCFKHNGIEYREWHGPSRVIVGSFSWFNVGELWEVYKEILPRSELGPHAPSWGQYPDEHGRAKTLAFGSGRPQRLKLTCGTEYIFLAYSQDDYVWKNFKSNRIHADEQILIDLLVAWMDGTRTMGDDKQAIFTMSGFRIEARPDSGMAGPIKRDIIDGRNTYGKQVGRYNLDLDSTPDAVVSKQNKRDAYALYADQTDAQGRPIQRSDKLKKQARACLLPGWEEGGGLFLSDWTRSIHVIPPLWKDADTPPRGARLFRVIDHGENTITCCAWIALFSSRNPYTTYSFAVIYRMLYRHGGLVVENAPEIIRMSGNTRAPMAPERDVLRGATYERYREVFLREKYYATQLDPRSAAFQRDGIPVGALYERYGLACSAAAGGRAATTMQGNTLIIGQWSYMRDWLRVDASKKHIATKTDGAPRLYLFDLPCNQPFIDEIEGLVEDENNQEKPDKKCPDHALECVRRWCAEGFEADVHYSPAAEEKRRAEIQRVSSGRRVDGVNVWTGYEPGDGPSDAQY